MRNENYGRRVYTWRLASVTDAGTDLVIPDGVTEIKEIQVHKEGATVAFTVLGNVDFTDRAAARLTTDGQTMYVPVQAFKGSIPFKLAADTGQTCNFSLIAWG